MEKIMRQTITIVATALLASSLLTAAAEARGGGNRGGAQFGSDRAHFDGINQNTMRRFDSSYPVFDRDYDPSCDNDWMPKQMWASSCS
jgi:hypothetical protein